MIIQRQENTDKPFHFRRIVKINNDKYFSYFNNERMQSFTHYEITHSLHVKVIKGLI